MVPPSPQALSHLELRAQFSALATALSGAASNRDFSFERGGRHVRATWLPPTKGTPAGVRIGVRVDAPGELFFGASRAATQAGAERPLMVHPGAVKFRRETGSDRWGKRLRINRELQTGDSSFDDLVYVESDASDDDLRRILAAAEVRQGVLACLSWFTDLTLERDGYLSVHKAGLQHGELSEEYFAWVADTLARMAAALPLMSPAPTRTRGAWKRGLVIATIVASIVAFLAVIVPVSVWETTGKELQRVAFVGSVVTWLAFAAFSFLALRARSTGFRDIILTLGFSLFGVPCAWVTTLYCVNCGLDFAAPSAHETEVLERWANRGKSTSYHVKLRPWRPGPRTLGARVSFAQYGAMPKGSVVVVTTKPGRLGFEWLQGIRLKSAP